MQLLQYWTRFQPTSNGLYADGRNECSCWQNDGPRVKCTLVQTFPLYSNCYYREQEQDSTYMTIE
jgi:hypothetical protein